MTLRGEAVKKTKDSWKKLGMDLADARDYILTPVSEVKVCVHCSGREDSDQGNIIHNDGCIFARARALRAASRKRKKVSRG